jgi:hypothetical protein
MHQSVCIKVGGQTVRQAASITHLSCSRLVHAVRMDMTSVGLCDSKSNFHPPQGNGYLAVSCTAAAATLQEQTCSNYAHPCMRSP